MRYYVTPGLFVLLNRALCVNLYFFVDGGARECGLSCAPRREEGQGVNLLIVTQCKKKFT